MASGRGGHVGGQRLSAFLDDELSEERALELTRHVAACGECRAELEALRSMRSALRDLSVIQAPVLTAEVRSTSAVGSWSKRVVALSAVTTLVLALGAAAYVVGGDGGEVVPPVERFLLDHLARTGDGPVPAPLGGLGR
ncbi:MAG: zf-HC2 domain-containing protein [Nitriliruptor sp.]|uniref:anti-sigma factor n=1 Tax=Nitriliruptor sp. TaxID=2448056 RepID=UPI0034A09757